jgi:hypothetical protein
MTAMQTVEEYERVRWEYVCEDEECPLHIPMPEGQPGEWVELEIDGKRVTLTWEPAANGRRVCPLHKPIVVDPRRADLEARCVTAG